MFERLTSWENLLLAFRKASRGKRGGPEVAAFEHHLEESLASLREQLLTGTYRPGAYHSFVIHEPKGRLISAAPFRDRVVHHALCNLIEPVFEASFSPASFANRIGKGTHRALARAQELARSWPYLLQLDIRQFFPSIDHAVLRAVIARKVPDDHTLRLVDFILEGGRGVLDEAYEMAYFPGDDLLAIHRPRGLPIGNLTSQFWANVYLDRLDHFIADRLGCTAYVRYVDDLLLFAGSKRLLWSWRAALRDELDALRLNVHPGAHPRPVTEGFPFLGFTIFPDRRRLKRRKGIHFRRRLGEQIEAFNLGQRAEQAVVASLQGWLNHVRYGDTLGLQRTLLAEVPGFIRNRLASQPGVWRPRNVGVASGGSRP